MKTKLILLTILLLAANIALAIEGVPATEQDILAAFVNVDGTEVIRGKGQIIIANGVPGCILQVFTEINGETITFKVWNFNTQMVYTAAQTLPSVVNGSVGSWPNNLYPINATSGMSQVAVPFFSPESGSYTTPISIHLGCLTLGASIRYTTDGSEPSEASQLFNAPINCPINSNLTLKARAYYLDYQPSMVATAMYNTSSSDDPGLVPLITGIESIFPNPFSAQTTIRLSLKDAHSKYTLKIYNIKGELVYQTSGQGKGYVEHAFNGCDKHGNRLAAGIYLLSFRSGDTHQTRKMVLQK